MKLCHIAKTFSTRSIFSALRGDKSDFPQCTQTILTPNDLTKCHCLQTDGAVAESSPNFVQHPAHKSRLLKIAFLPSVNDSLSIRALEANKKFLPRLISCRGGHLSIADDSCAAIER